MTGDNFDDVPGQPLPSHGVEVGIDFFLTSLLGIDLSVPHPDGDVPPGTVFDAKTDGLAWDSPGMDWSLYALANIYQRPVSCVHVDGHKPVIILGAVLA